MGKSLENDWKAGNDAKIMGKIIGHLEISWGK
jgi:hypothetical protein